MPKNRVVLTFSATPGGPFVSLAGWSETYWRNVDEAPDTLLNAIVGTSSIPITIGMLARRRDLMTAGWRIDGVKVYPITGGRIATAATLPGNTGAGMFPLAADANEQQPYDRLLWKMNATGGHSRSARLGGISSTVVDAGGNYSGPGTVLAPPGSAGDFHGRLADTLGFFPMLVEKQFGLRFVTVSDPHDIVAVVTDPIVVAGASARTPVIAFTGNVTAVFPAGATVRISNSISPARLNGQWTIRTVSVVGALTYVKLAAKRSLTITGEYEIGAYARALTFEVAAMTAGFPIRGVSRKPGRPSGLPRGRRSRRT